MADPAVTAQDLEQIINAAQVQRVRQTAEADDYYSWSPFF